MSLKGERRIYHFLLIQILCIITELIIVGVCYPNEKQFKFLQYSLPILVLYMISYYFLFWWSIFDRIKLFVTINILLFLISCGLYFGVFYGIFNKILSIQLQEVSRCTVIGKQSKNLGGSEFYSILYVNYEQGGKQKLGYACQSSLHQAPLNSQIIPNEFYYNLNKFVCQSEEIEINENHRMLKLPKNTNQQQQKAKYNPQTQQNKRPERLSQRNKICYEQYTFSEVKLPSWMCLPWNTPFENLIESKSCYVNYFGNTILAEENSLNRTTLKQNKSFALISFDQLPVPFKSYLCFLIFVFNFLILSFNGFYFYLVRLIKLQMISFSMRRQQIIKSTVVDSSESQKEISQNNQQQLHVKPNLYIHTKSQTVGIQNMITNKNHFKPNIKSNSTSSKNEEPVFIKIFNQENNGIIKKQYLIKEELKEEEDINNSQLLETQKAETLPTQNDQISEGQNFILETQQSNPVEQYELQILQNLPSNRSELSLNIQNQSLDQIGIKEENFKPDKQISKSQKIISGNIRKKLQATTTSYN